MFLDNRNIPVYVRKRSSHFRNEVLDAFSANKRDCVQATS